MIQKVDRRSVGLAQQPPQQRQDVCKNGFVLRRFERGIEPLKKLQSSNRSDKIDGGAAFTLTRSSAELWMVCSTGLSDNSSALSE